MLTVFLRRPICVVLLVVPPVLRFCGALQRSLHRVQPLRGKGEHLRIYLWWKIPTITPIKRIPASFFPAEIPAWLREDLVARINSQCYAATIVMANRIFLDDF